MHMIVKKVAVLVAAFTDGGAERVMVNLANGMAERGIEVDLVMRDPSGNYADEIAEAVKVVDLQEQNLSKALLKLIKYLRAERPQILLATQKHVNIIATLATKLSLTKTKVIIRESNTATIAQHNVGSRAERLTWHLAKLIYPFADGCVSCSRGMTEDMHRFYRWLPQRKIRTIYSPIVTPAMMQSAKEEVQHPFFASGAPVVIALGRITRQKDFPTLIKAFAKVRTRRHVKLLILGSADYGKSVLEQLKHLVNELHLEQDVDLAGFKKNPFAWLNKSQVFVLSSLYEGLPGALIQALAIGCNLVSTDCPNGPAEILQNGKLGALVPVGDVEQLADAIEAALEKPLDRRLGFTHASPFHVDTAVDEFVKYFEEVASPRL